MNDEDAFLHSLAKDLRKRLRNFKITFSKSTSEYNQTRIIISPQSNEKRYVSITKTTSLYLIDRHLTYSGWMGSSIRHWDLAKPSWSADIVAKEIIRYYKWNAKMCKLIIQIKKEGPESPLQTACGPKPSTPPATKSH